MPPSTIEGMVEGLWLAPDLEEVPVRPPYVQASSAILPLPGVSVDAAEQFTCLDLVLVPTIDPPGEFEWVVMSEAATYTYSHTIGLNRAETGWRFVAWPANRVHVFEATYAPTVGPAIISALYGPEASGRARRDRAAVQLTLTRV
jgi:hypothetical protein